MSADAITTCPKCLEIGLREYWDLYCLDERGDIVRDEPPYVRPVTYVVRIELKCRLCIYEADLRMESPLP